MNTQERAQDTFLSSIIDHLPVAVSLADKQGNFVFHNEAAKRLWGSLALPSSIDQLSQCTAYRSQDRQRVKPEEWNLMKAWRRGDVSADEIITIECPDGVKKTVISWAVPLKDSRGEINGAVGLMHDVTDKVRLEEALYYAERMASIGTLATGIAHEINNPLASILAIVRFVQMNKKHPQAEAILDKALSDISIETKRCGDIVKGILKFARNEASEKWPASLNEVILKSVTICHEYASSFGVRIVTEINPAVPEVMMNPTQMEQVAVNLLRNAVEATAAVSSAERPIRQVVIKTFLKGRRSCGFLVEDSGCGVTEQQKKHMFDPFFTTRRESGGVGLGLSVCHGIVSDHGGKLKANSSPLGGLSMDVILPIEVEH